MRDVLERALDEIRPTLLADGGNVELASIESGGVVKLRLLGNCTACPGRDMTLALSLEPLLKERVPGLRSIVIV